MQRRNEDKKARKTSEKSFVFIYSTLWMLFSISLQRTNGRWCWLDWIFVVWRFRRRGRRYPLYVFMNAACLLHSMPVRPSTVCLLDLLLFLAVKCFCAIAYLVSRVAGGWLVVVAQWLVDWLNLGRHSTLYATPCVAVSQYVQSFELSASHRPPQPHTTTQ